MVPPPPHSPPTLACISSMTTRPGGVSSPFCGIHLRPAHPAPPRPQRTRGQGQQHPSPTALARALVVLPLPLPSPSPWLRRALLLASPPPPPPPRAKDTDAHIHRPPTHPPPRHPPTNPTPSTHSPSLGDRRLRAAGTWARLLGLLLPLSSSSAVFVQAPAKRV